MTAARAKISTNVRIVQWAIAAADRLSPRWAVELATRAFLTPPRPPRPDRERHLLASAQGSTVSAGGLELRAWSWGHGPTVLLVHGWGGRGGQLGALVPALTGLGHRVVTFDAPAHGDSPGRRTTLAAMGAVVGAVAAQLGGVDTIVAHSFGAAATTVALGRGLAVRRVAYLAPMFDVPAGVERFVALAGLSAAARAIFLEEVTMLNQARTDELDGAALAPRQTAPLLVVHDRDDREVPYTDGVTAAALWPGARLITTAGLGHQRLLGDRDVVAAVRDFVGGAPVRPGVLDETARIERDLSDREGRRDLIDARH